FASSIWASRLKAFGHSEPRLSSADDPHSFKADSAAGAATNHARVTSEQMRVFLRNLKRQTVIFARSAGRQAQIWWRALRAAMQSAHTSFGERWPGLKARLQSSIKNARWPKLTPKPFEGRQLRVMPKAWRNPRVMKFRAKTLAVFIALGLVLLFGFALYSIATLPIGGGLQVEATQSALTFEGAQDRKSTRLNSSHRTISYAVFCLK